MGNIADLRRRAFLSYVSDSLAQGMDEDLCDYVMALVEADLGGSPSFADVPAPLMAQAPDPPKLDCNCRAGECICFASVETPPETPEPFVPLPWRADCKCGAIWAQDCKCDWPLPGQADEFSVPIREMAAQRLEDAEREAVAALLADLRAAEVRANSERAADLISNARIAAALNPTPGRCLVCRLMFAHCTCGRPQPEPAVSEAGDEAAAREWIVGRMRTANLRHDDAPRIEIVDLMMFTGWEKSRAVKFVHCVQDEMRPPSMRGARSGKVSLGATGLGALIAAVNEAPDDDSESGDDLDAAEAVAFPASGENAKGETVPYWIRGGYGSENEYKAAYQYRTRVEKRGGVFDQSAWLKQRREKQAAGLEVVNG